jgi:hypothetical protein
MTGLLKRGRRDNPKELFYLRQRPRHFEYLSTAKIDELFNQIPSPVVQTITASFGIKLPDLPGVPLQAGVRVDTALQRGARNEYGKLAVVVRRQHELGDVRTVGRPAGFFAGVMSLRWASAAKKFVFLSGHSGKTLVVLTGSLDHLVGRLGQLPEVRDSGSSTHGAYDFLEELFEGKWDDRSLLERFAFQNQKGPTQVLEFVAVRLARERGYPSQGEKLGDFEVFRDSGYMLLHGSPLYLSPPAG